MKEYTTVLGDTWDLIAFKVYKNEKHAQKLIEANQDHINTVIFKSNVKLNIPEIKEEVSSLLPPWKRG